MTWQLTPFASTFFLSALLILAVEIIAFRHINVRGARYFIWLVFSVETWVLFMGLEYAAVEPAWKIIFAKFEYLGIATIGATWLLFALSYTRRHEWLMRRNFALLFIIPAITLILVFTNELHGLIWTRITPSSPVPGASLIYDHGVAFYVIFIFDYITLALGTILITLNSLRARDIYRWQMIGLIASAIIPWIGNIVYIANLSPIPGLDLTPLGFALSAVVIAFSMFYFGLFDLVPIARDQLVEGLMDGVLVIDTARRVADINPRARDLLGIGTEPVVGRPVDTFLMRWSHLAERFRDVESAQTEIHIDNQSISDVELRISPLTDERGYLIGRLVVIRDITDRKRLEKLRDDLVHAMVHDLRSPLGAVMLSMDLLKMELAPGLTKEQVRTFETGEQSVQQILKLVNSILDISRLENGELPLRRSLITVQSVVTEAVEAQGMAARKKQITFEQLIPHDLVAVMMDPELMRRVFQNLLDNAVKFSKDNDVIQIEAGYSQDGREIMVSVCDHGPGFQDDIKNRLFEKFASGKIKNSGSGLGLAFCRLVVEAHGGRIWAEQNTGVGAIISLTIPLY